MNPYLVEIGNIKIYWYSVLILVAFLVGGFIIYKEAIKQGIDHSFIIDLFFYTIPFALIGARLYYVLFEWDYYRNNLMDIFKVWEGGLAIHGGIFFGCMFVIWYSKRKNVRLRKLFDILVVGLIIGQAIGRWGNFFNQEAYGAITSYSNLIGLHIPKFIVKNMFIGGFYHHPTFFYESIGCFLGFLILIFIRKTKIKEGYLTSFYLVWYGVLRFFIESSRTDSLMIGNLKMAQIVSIFMILFGLIYFFMSRKKSCYYNKKN